MIYLTRISLKTRKNIHTTMREDFFISLKARASLVLACRMGAASRRGMSVGCDDENFSSPKECDAANFVRFARFA